MLYNVPKSHTYFSHGWFSQTLPKIMKNGARIPEKIAIIMDGNRRFAKEKLNAEKHVGHSHGLQKLIDTMEWCLELGLKEVAVYALAINNLKRSKKEVNVLFL